MADFRKCLLAFAVLALLSSFAVPANAQTGPALQCTTNASVTPTVRAEGLAELVGDIVLNCTGGTSTANGATVPAANIVVFLSTNITSRSGDILLMIDEPHSPANSAPLALCTTPTCNILGTGSGVGTYNGTTGRPNVFKAAQIVNNQVLFLGIPIDPPGTNPNRTIRITNIRGNANQLGVSSTLIPTQIVANISVTPSTILPLNNPQQLVAFVQRGLTTSVRSATSFVQCIDENRALAGNSTADAADGSAFSVRFEEGFPSAWKEKNIQYHLSVNCSGSACTGSIPTVDAAQDVPGSNYFSESGFVVNGNTPVAATTPPGYGPFLTANPAIANLAGAGVASQGTRLMLTFNNIPAISGGFTGVFVPTYVNIIDPSRSSSNLTGRAYLVSTDSNGAGSFSPVSLETDTQISTSAGTGNSGLLSPISVVGGTGTAVYEVIYAEPFVPERMDVPVVVAFVANTGNDFPAPGLQTTVAAGYAPVSTVGTTSDTAPIPRFVPGTAGNAFIINKCSCNMLFPFVSNQAGFDTGIAISNTSVDPFGTTPQSGFLTVNYYSGGTPPPAQRTNATIPGGQTLAFSLSGGGNFGIAATPGFQGYIITQAEFQYCHGVAYLSAVGNPYSGLGYLGIVLDDGSLNRTDQPGEVKAH